MRPERFMKLAVQVYQAAPEVAKAEPWQEGTERPFGVKVTFTTGAQLWHAITAQAAPGEDYDAPEQPVEADPPAEVPVPDLYEGGRVTPQRAEQYLAALLNNARNPEIKSTYAYSDPTPDLHPGFGVMFHSGARGFCVFVHSLRPGQQSPGTRYELQAV